MFEEAIEAASKPHLGNGRCWYPYSYLVGYLTRRARFILKDAAALLGPPRLNQESTHCLSLSRAKQLRAAQVPKSLDCTGEGSARQAGYPLLHQALKVCGKGGAARVLQSYRWGHHLLTTFRPGEH